MPREIPQTNLVSMAAVLFTGSTFTEIKDWAHLCNIQLPCSTTFYDYQASYFLPVIEEEYEMQRKSIVATLIDDAKAGREVHLCGDGRHVMYIAIDNVTVYIWYSLVQTLALPPSLCIVYLCCFSSYRQHRGDHRMAVIT